MPGAADRLEVEDVRVAIPPGDRWASGSGTGDGGRRAAAEPAGCWRRAFALLVDVAVAGLLLGLGSVLARPLRRWDLVAEAFRVTWWLVVPTAYVVLGHGTGGQTLGKRLLGARVIGAGGGDPGYVRALVRLGATVLAAAPFGLGLLLAAFRRDRRGLHDLLAGTRVIRSGR